MGVLNRRAPITRERVADMAVQQVLFGGVEPVLISPFDCVLKKDGPCWGSLGMWKLKMMGERKNDTNEPVHLIPRVSKKHQAPGCCCCRRNFSYIYVFLPSSGLILISQVPKKIPLLPVFQDIILSCFHNCVVFLTCLFCLPTHFHTALNRR